MAAFRWNLSFAVVLACCAPALASQSLVLTGSPKSYGVAQLPATAAFANLSDWRIEGQADNWAGSPTDVGLFEVDSTCGITIMAGNMLRLYGYGSESASLPLGSIKAFRWVAQHSSSTGKYTLEVWDQATGAYLESATQIVKTGAVNISNYHFSIGSFYEPTPPNIHLGFLRWYSSTRPLGGAPPVISFNPRDRPGDLIDFEFEGNIKDASPQRVNFSFSAGSASYATTAAFPPIVNLSSVPLTTRAASPLLMDASASFSNLDSPVVSCQWSEVSTPYPGTFSSPAQCITSYTPPVFGTYVLNLTVSDKSGQTARQQFKVGAVATDNNGVVIVANPQIDALLGPMIQFGANPWPWFDNRQKVAADNQINLQSTVWADFWDTADPNGTIACTKGSATCTGTGTQFQTEFCSGNMVPANAGGAGIVIWYPSTDYPGTFGRAHYYVTGCPTQTSITLNVPYVHSATASGMNYTADPTGNLYGAWSYSAIPGNYYDNVLAFYNLYYRSGIDTYLNAARTLAAEWWAGPFWDRGKSFDVNNVGGNFIIAPPGRGISPTGIVLWALESGANIWPGIRHVWDYDAMLIPANVNARQIGDIREAAYITATPALCVLFDPNPPAECAQQLTAAVEQWWAPLQASGGNFTNTNAGNALFAASDGSVYVTATQGSPNITLTGSSWSAGTFLNGNYPGNNLNAWLWFFNNPNQPNIPGNSSSTVGDTTVYQVCNVTDATHAVLCSNYNGTSGKHGLLVSAIAGFGTQPFMLGLAAGAFSAYDYLAFRALGQTSDLTLLKKMASASLTWLTSTGFDAPNHDLYGARTFLNCEPNPNSDPSCASGLPVNGEAMRGFSAGYLLTGDPMVLSAGDAFYQALWCKPGWACPIPASGTYLSDIDDAPSGYMINSQSLSNKWFGFFFGYGFGSSWPAARVGGVAPAQLETTQVPVNFAGNPQAAGALLTVVQPNGVTTQTTCSSSPCSVTVDARQGNHLVKIDLLDSSGMIVTPGTFSVLSPS